MNHFRYTSLHHYLDDVLSDITNPNHTQIKQAKRDYWKHWYRHYRRKSREQYKEFTLRFDPEHLKLISERKGKLSVSKFLYQAIEQALVSNRLPITDSKQLGELNQNLMRLVNLLEEHLEEQPSELTESLLLRFEGLETEVTNLLNHRQ